MPQLTDEEEQRLDEAPPHWHTEVRAPHWCCHPLRSLVLRGMRFRLASEVLEWEGTVTAAVCWTLVMSTRLRYGSLLHVVTSVHEVGHGHNEATPVVNPYQATFTSPPVSTHAIRLHDIHELKNEGRHEIEHIGQELCVRIVTSFQKRFQQCIMVVHDREMASGHSILPVGPAFLSLHKPKSNPRRVRDKPQCPNPKALPTSASEIRISTKTSPKPIFDIADDG
ncbi:hypothetical protein ANN_03678 [Periplaneta americana]|uniref:Uncharacterized protein n=1 Tax=Periplaneta americana TaxID=6978 RepID=A0ABQ8U5G0_PERAM|nr:hypothetical protein ANN_03678 [Periplaneta americana]